jgi:hypothetical protein
MVPARYKAFFRRSQKQLSTELFLVFWVIQTWMRISGSRIKIQIQRYIQYRLPPEVAFKKALLKLAALPRVPVVG